MKIKKVVVIGLGYIGLPTLVAIAKTNQYTVAGYDIDSKKINLIRKHISPIEDEEVGKYIKENELKVSNNKNILIKSDVFIICVPTPVKNDYTPDYSYIESAVRIIAPFIKKGSHVVLESTVNPGTCHEIIAPILEINCRLQLGKDYNLTHCPERINPGDNKWNIYNINRNIGSANKKLNKEIANFYKSFITQAVINEVSTIEIAEASKIIENAFRDINIAYVNELAKSFDALGINLYETIKAASNKPFGFMPHYPGCGVGGHCIGVDPYYLIRKAEKNGFNHSFLKLAREINNSMPEYTVQKLILGLNEIGKSVNKTKISLLGLSYKPNLADTRESPAVKIMKRLTELGADLKTYDPYISSDFTSLKNAVKDTECIVLTTAHTDFLENLPVLLPGSKVKLIVDGRNCLDKSMIEKYKIIYKGIGR